MDRKKWIVLTIVMLCTVIALFVNIVLFSRRGNEKAEFDEEMLTRQAQAYYDKGREIYEEALKIKGLTKQMELRKKAYESCLRAIETIELIMNHYRQINREVPENARWNKLWHETTALLYDINVFIDYGQ